VLYTGNYSTWWNLLVGSGAGNVTHGVMASRWRLIGATISARLLCAGAYGGSSPWGPLSRRHNVAQVWACLLGFCEPGLLGWQVSFVGDHEAHVMLCVFSSLSKRGLQLGSVFKCGLLLCTLYFQNCPNCIVLFLHTLRHLQVTT
jgi:predicted MFS family arabinose efflux permease